MNSAAELEALLDEARPDSDLPGVFRRQGADHRDHQPRNHLRGMVIVGQQMHDSFAEALDDVVVCVMTKADVQRLLLGDQRIAARISETLGRRLAELDSVCPTRSSSRCPNGSPAPWP